MYIIYDLVIVRIKLNFHRSGLKFVRSEFLEHLGGPTSYKLPYLLQQKYIASSIIAPQFSIVSN